MQVVSRSEEETHQIGQQIGRRLKPPRVVLLSGQLGSGKTILARGIAEGLKIPQQVVVRSPSFTLVNEYPSPAGTIYHLDLYRLETPAELYSIGIDEILCSDSIVMVEWAEKLQLPVDGPLNIQISPGDTPRLRLLDIEPAIALPDQQPESGK